jgi:hypothetical protein
LVHYPPYFWWSNDVFSLERENLDGSSGARVIDVFEHFFFAYKSVFQAITIGTRGNPFAKRK